MCLCAAESGDIGGYDGGAVSEWRGTVTVSLWFAGGMVYCCCSGSTVMLLHAAHTKHAGDAAGAEQNMNKVNIHTAAAYPIYRRAVDRRCIHTTQTSTADAAKKNVLSVAEAHTR